MTFKRALPFLLTLGVVVPVVAQTPAELIKQADRVFFREEDMSKAEPIYRRAMNHPDATRNERARAHRYMCACVGRRGEIAKCLEMQKVWLDEYRNHRKRHYTLLFQGIYLRRLKREKEARAAWQLVLDEVPRSAIADRVRLELNRGKGGSGGGRSHRPRRKPIVYEPGRILPADVGRRGEYLVVKVGLTKRAFKAVASEVADYHRGKTIDFDGKNFAWLTQTLASRRPGAVLYVVQPEDLDVNLHRHLLMASVKVDSDIFPDFGFGYFTARNGKSLRQLWARTKRLHKNGLSTKTWHDTAVTSSMRSMVYQGTIEPHQGEAGFTGNRYYFGTVETDPNNMDFVKRRLRDLEQASVITMTGCGDPQGIWLFNDQRNRDRSKHWEYDPEKVGDDPLGEMPRITADYFKKLKLGQGPVMWTGVCHIGAPQRVFIEGDIVSTFGRVRKTTLYEMAPEESVCLALIDAGVTAFLCPIAANHGMSVSREVNFALQNGATLGETMKSTYDDIYLASRGALELGIQIEGEKHKQPEYVMQGGGANRILIGDPALRPFRATSDPKETFEVRNKTASSFEVVVNWKQGHHPRGWDMFGWDRRRDWVMRTRVALDDLVPAGRKLAFTAEVQGSDLAGNPLPYEMRHSEPEVFRGRRYLHLQANAPRREVSGKAVRVVFRVSFKAKG